MAAAGSSQLNANARPFVPEPHAVDLVGQDGIDSSDDGENESLGLLDEDWQGGLYGDEDYFSDDDEYDEQEELEDDFMDQFRASVPSTASSADY